ncbi:glycosyltransferase family 2 protein [Actinomyces vulturis]|uniref:glycosyltransferase family 2 protein n=1 Tax=Actinomyces vulturis TaxID=1857645 RepID=UPI000832B332|nr:glycosyltransferase family 2 protein [Actinomyces vulturis]
MLSAETDAPPRHIIAVVPAHNEQDRITTTLMAISAIDGVEHIIVVDDGSTDSTVTRAREAGAQVLSHAICQGKAQAMDTGAKEAFRRARIQGCALDDLALLFIDADLEDSARHCAPLVDAIRHNQTDVAIAVLPPQEGSGGKGRVVRLARHGINEVTGYQPIAPLSGQRCIRARLYRDLMPMAQGWGIEVAMTITALRYGARVLEVPCELTHRVTGKDLKGILHRADQACAVVRTLRHQGLSLRCALTPLVRSGIGAPAPLSPEQAHEFTPQVYRMPSRPRR